jgi:dihydropteroate synthase
MPLGTNGAFTIAKVMARDGDDGVDERYVSATELRQSESLASAAGPDPFEGVLQHLARPVLWPGALPPPPLLMGIVNVTPDSFYDGGRWNDPGRAGEHGHRLAAEGAALVDVGGESTRPGSAAVEPAEELARVVPVVRALAAAGVRVSIDTRRAEVMAAALDAGAMMVNDVTALRHDPKAVELIARSGVPVILMHMQGEPSTMQRAPSYRRACLDVLDFLLSRADWAETNGVRPEQVILDPGIGFGKTLEHNLDILRHLGLYRGHGRPLALGLSRKSFLGRVSSGEPAADRLPGTLAAHLASDSEDVQILRVHDVAEMRQALAVRSALVS